MNAATIHTTAIPMLSASISMEAITANVNHII